MTLAAPPLPTAHAIARPSALVSLEITGRCQLSCRMCYADSGPTGTHGSMTIPDWERVIDEAAELGVPMIEFIGGEPTTHPGLPRLVRRVLDREMQVEVFTNLLRVTPPLWETFTLPGVQLATSYFSDDAAEHDAITGRVGSYVATKANIANVLRHGIPLRVGIVGVHEGQRVEQARVELAALGVDRIGYDPQREVGRAARGQQPDASQLCGQCGDGLAAINPTGAVTACVMSRWLVLGNVHDRSLAEITAGLPAARAALAEQGMPTDLHSRARCGPDGQNCYPIHCHPRT